MESQSSTVELVKELQVWCRREELDEDHAVMVVIQEDRENAQIEETMGNIKALGRVRVRGRTLSLKLNLQKVLCECKDVSFRTCCRLARLKSGGSLLLLKILFLVTVLLLAC